MVVPVCSFVLLEARPLKMTYTVHETYQRIHIQEQLPSTNNCYSHGANEHVLLRSLQQTNRFWNRQHNRDTINVYFQEVLLICALHAPHLQVFSMETAANDSGGQGCNKLPLIGKLQTQTTNKVQFNKHSQSERNKLHKLIRKIVATLRIKNRCHLDFKEKLLKYK